MDCKNRMAWWLGWAAAVVMAGCQGAAGPLTPAATLTPFLPVLPTATMQASNTPVPTAMPLPTTTPLPTVTPVLLPSPTRVACIAESGRMELNSTAQGAPLTVRIYLPPCYGEPEGTRYPVLYILHGQTYKDDQWDRLGMDEAAEAMIKAGEAPPFLIVMPLEANTLADPFETQFGKRVAEELLPWIDAHYLTCAERECRAIGGLSRGGAWALNTGFDYWQSFSAVGLHSTPPFVGAYRVRQWVLTIPTDQLPRLWLDTGRQDWYIQYTTEFEAILSAENVPHEWTLFDGTHDEAYWSSHVHDYLTWYTQPWKDSFPIKE
jgi:enterochelin esterase-like enzyme